MRESQFHFEATSESAVPAAVNVEPAWGANFGHSHSVTVDLKLDLKVYLFLHRSLQATDPKEIKALLGKNSVVGYVLGPNEQLWTVEAEATTEGEFGIIVYTKAGKPYVAGQGHYNSAGLWSVQFATLYPGIKNSLRCKLQGGAKGGTGQKTQVQGGGVLEGTF
jgi:hypothetical protein